MNDKSVPQQVKISGIFFIEKVKNSASITETFDGMKNTVFPNTVEPTPKIISREMKPQKIEPKPKTISGNDIRNGAS